MVMRMADEAMGFLGPERSKVSRKRDRCTRPQKRERRARYPHDKLEMFTASPSY